MKCFFVTGRDNEGKSVYQDLIRNCLRSAREKTSLEFHALYDGDPTDETYRRFVEAGIDVTIHRLSFKDQLRDYYTHAYPEDSDCHISKRNFEHCSCNFLKFDIPDFCSDELVLYVDIDTEFCRDYDWSSLKTATIAVAPEFRKEYDVIKGNRYFNAGIMLINVPELRKRRERMLKMLAERRLCYMECWDQGFFNELYKGEFDELPLTFNWKPYWGINDQAVIVHYHWMKPNKAWNDYDVMLHAMHLDLQGEAAQVGMLHYMRRFIAANCPDKVAFLDGFGSLFFKAEQRRRDLALENARRLFREADPREWLPKGKRTALDKIKRRIAKWLIASLRQD